MLKLTSASSVSFLALLSFGMCAAPAALAQAQPQASSSEDEEIIVTATRREQALQDVPIAVSAFNAQDLSRLNVVSTNDL